MIDRYDCLGRVYAERDHDAALANLKTAIAACRDLQRIDPDGRQVDEMRRRLQVYRSCRRRLLAVRPYVDLAGGHPPIPETPPGVRDPGPNPQVEPSALELLEALDGTPEWVLIEELLPPLVHALQAAEQGNDLRARVILGEVVDQLRTRRAAIEADARKTSM